jgi:hypothetical protein
VGLSCHPGFLVGETVKQTVVVAGKTHLVCWENHPPIQSQNKEATTFPTPLQNRIEGRSRLPFFARTAVRSASHVQGIPRSHLQLVLKGESHHFQGGFSF